MSHPFAIFVALILISASPPGARAQRSRSTSRALFGRKWFMKASDSEARGFLIGYDDCLPNRAERMLPGWYLPTETMVDRIRVFYAKHKTSTLDVAQVALRIAAGTPAPHKAPGGEAYTNRRGFLDGLWWKGAFNDEQPGYVEGYLVCLKHPAGSSVARRLADEIGAWYRKHPSREDYPIANVLEGILRAERKAK